MKRGLAFVTLLTFLTNFVSAQFYSGYGRFSFSNFFSSLDPQTVTLTALFLIFFAFIFFGLSKIFKGPTGEPNKPISGTISFAVSFLITYGLYRTGFNINNFFFNIGIPTEFFYSLIPFLLLAILIFLSWRFTLSTVLMTFGIFLIAITLIPDLIYEKGVAAISGVILFLIGFFWRRWRNRGLGNLPRSPRWGFGRGRRGNIYQQGMRRGGEKPTRSRFVSQESVNRYERRFGRRAARRRFGR